MSRRKQRSTQLQQLAEVDKDTLSSLWAQVTGQVTSRTNRSLEHEVEGERIRERVAIVSDLQIAEYAGEFVDLVSIGLKCTCTES